MSCARVSVLVNGLAGSKFFIERGLRQDCPLSWLLFNLVAKALLISMNQFEDNQWMLGTHIPGLSDIVMVLQYAGDTILFLH